MGCLVLLCEEPRRKSLRSSDCLGPFLPDWTSLGHSLMIPQFEEFLNISHSLLLIGFCPSFNKQFGLTTLVLSLELKRKPFVNTYRVKRKKASGPPNMGLKSYFKPNRAPPPQAAVPLPILSEKKLVPVECGLAISAPTTTRPESSTTSLTPSSRTSTYIDEIKHEVIVNYLYQQQCSHLWVKDSSGQYEGVMLRKSRNNYLAYPPQLVDSPFGIACAALNCQVSHLARIEFSN